MSETKIETNDENAAIEICYTCGMIYPESIEVIHARDPTLKRGAIHILLLPESFIVSYSAPYHPDLHPLYPMPPRKRVKAMLDFAELTREAELILNQPEDFRKKLSMEVKAHD
jgi:hypothetical protein